MNQIESLKAQIEYMREIDCDKLANLLVEDLKREEAYVAKDYSQEARDAARAKYGRKD